MQLTLKTNTVPSIRAAVTCLNVLNDCGERGSCSGRHTTKVNLRRGAGGWPVSISLAVLMRESIIQNGRMAKSITLAFHHYPVGSN